MLELSIPQAGEETRNSKDLVFSVISREHPLSAIEIVNRIRKRYHASLTYQAIKKAIDNLVEKGVLEKDERKYRINRSWLLDLKGFSEKLLTQYDNTQVLHSFDANLADEQYATYTLTSLLELDNFWDDMLIHLAKKLTDEPRIFISRTYYSWWLLINLGREMHLFERLAEEKMRCMVLILRDLPLNRWAEKIYSARYGKCGIFEEGLGEEDISLNIIGNTVIQVKYPEEIIGNIRSFYEKYANTQEMSVREITELANRQCEIKFIVFKNAEVASSLREKYLAMF